MRLQKKSHAPYTYLTQDSQGLYHLFTAVPLRLGYDRRLANPSELAVQYLNGITIVTIELQQSNSITQHEQGALWTYFPLDPNGQSNFNFNPDSDEILVEVLVYETDTLLEEEFSSTILYIDRDNQAPPPESLAARKAFNSPYTYLEEIDSNTQGDENMWGYQPYMLLPLKGYDVNPDHILITTPENGIYESVVVLSNQPVAAGNFQLTSNFNVNRDVYYDGGQVEGNFTATVVLEDNIEPSLSLVGSPAKRLHNSLKDIEQNRYLPNNQPAGNVTVGGGRPGTGTSNGDQPSPIVPPARTVGRRVRRRRARTRNMSSRRRSPMFLDFRYQSIIRD